MLTRFFIHRPIFATVLSIAIALSGAIALFTLPIAQYPQITPPGVQVSIQYPGASAQVVADTVAAPIEQQVNGVDHMLYMSSQSGNDGSYTLTVTFDIGTDTNTALVMVQNRVLLALQLLPTSVQNQGILIRKKTPDILMVVNLYSPSGLRDDVYLSNYATINVKDELLRVAGVSDITYLRERDYSIRAWLDPQKLASLGMTANDVANAVVSQNLDAPAGQVGQPPASSKQSSQLPIDTLGRLTEPEQFGDIIIKATLGQQPPTYSVSSPSASSTSGLPNPIGTKAAQSRNYDIAAGQRDHQLAHRSGAEPVGKYRPPGPGGHAPRREWWNHQFQRANFQSVLRQQQDGPTDRDWYDHGGDHGHGGRPEWWRRLDARRGLDSRRGPERRRLDHFRQYHGEPGEQPRAYQFDRRRQHHRHIQWQHDRDWADRTDRQHRAASRRGPRRTRRSELQPGLHLRSTSLGRPGHLATARHQCAGRRQPGQSQNGGIEAALSLRCGV